MTVLPSIIRRIATELAVREPQVAATIALLDEGSTVPFIARYRKEATGGLDDTQLRTLDERLTYLRDLEDRRAAILSSISEQGKLTDALKAKLDEAETKARLEDLYLPFKPKRRTKAQIAREQGLAPLAEGLLTDPSQVPDVLAATFVDADKGVADVKAALDGARQILMEQFAEDADLLGRLREHLWDSGVLTAQLVDGMADKGAKFADYFDYSETIRTVPSHRALALLRGRTENVLSLKLVPADEAVCERMIAVRFGITDQGRPADAWLLDTVRWTWKVKLHLHVELELVSRLREAAEAEAIRVFALNLKALLLQAPAGMLPTLGLDPGIRTGVKAAALDATGKVVDTATLYPFPPRNDLEGSLAALAALCRRHAIRLIAIGNGTASRETERLVAEMNKRHPELKVQKVVVNEAGASVYSASELAAREFPDMDVTLRGAVSIARRLQDPLAELVKIDPKSIGVGQYQHDVNQTQLGHSLDAVVEDCVNAVGVEVNTASAALLARVAGLSSTVAGNIVAFRDRNGPFPDRESLKQVERLGAKAFEQSAGFLRIRNGRNPLDASAVHPESYPVVQAILARCNQPITAVIGDTALLRRLSPTEFVNDRFGEPTVRDIIKELEKPGRDPRPDFKTASFQDGVEEIKDLKPGMVLEGCVTNVTNFGAFVDIGVHQDGLVHISALADHFVKDPHTVVHPGDVVRVKVLEVDLPRKRIALTMRMGDVPAAASSATSRPTAPTRPERAPRSSAPTSSGKSGGNMGDSGGGSLALAFAQAQKGGAKKRP